MNFLDRVIAELAPQWGAQRARARAQIKAYEKARAVYDGARVGRRSKGWNVVSTDANSELLAGALGRLRDNARDLDRNNPFARRGLDGIAHNVIGAGILPQFTAGSEAATDRLRDLRDAHLNTTAIDAGGTKTLAGIQIEAARTVALSGEVLVRRRRRRAEDGLPLPFQLEVLEPDFIDQSKDGELRNGHRIIQGIEFDAIGRRVAYHLFRSHPGGSSVLSWPESRRIPAGEVAHVFREDRPGQVRGVPWLAPVMLRVRDFADYEDATLVKQKVAAAFSVFVTQHPDIEPPAVDVDEDDQRQETIRPGQIEYMQYGQEVSFPDPPTVSEYDAYAKSQLRAIAAGLGVTYELLTGDLAGVNYSSGRMGWLEFQRSISAWQRNIFIPQLCEPIGRWFIEAAAIGANVQGDVSVSWTPPRREMIDLAVEVPAKRNAIRAGLSTWSDEIRAMGKDPKRHFEELAADRDVIDAFNLFLDSDARKTSLAGVTNARPEGSENPA